MPKLDLLTYQKKKPPVISGGFLLGEGWSAEQLSQRVLTQQYVELTHEGEKKQDNSEARGEFRKNPPTVEGRKQHDDEYDGREGSDGDIQSPLVYREGVHDRGVLRERQGGDQHAGLYDHKGEEQGVFAHGNLRMRGN
jgi:hypothetical protein